MGFCFNDCQLTLELKAKHWSTSYLTDRSQFVEIDVSEADKHSLLCGGPQGSVLGPILYLLYNVTSQHVISLLCW